VRGANGRGGLPALEAAGSAVRGGLTRLGTRLEAEGLAVSAWSGQLIRPLVGYAGAVAADVRRGPDAASLWYALGAVQLAHEASLLHDDVIDGAGERRGEATVVASRGVAAALVEGDHLLTTAYRLAARTGNVDWVALFAEAVERTVAGEKMQGRLAGRVLDRRGYEALVSSKSGELLGAALAAAPLLAGDVDWPRYRDLGRRLGVVYQMLDDLLDYCPHVTTGKPPLRDHARGLWTWPLEYVTLSPDLDATAMAAAFRVPDLEGRTVLERCLERYREAAASLLDEAAVLLPGDAILPALVGGWIAAAESAARRTVPAVELPPVAGWEGLMEEHARSFRFAAHLFPSERRAQVSAVYAWCRYTDNLVDGVLLPAPELEARLDTWLDLSRRAYAGERTGNVLADRVMADMRDGGVPFAYAAELIEGMRMDVRGVTYGTMADLRVYTYRVASVVGLWLTELFGIRDPWMLERAAALGHAMQLTNILRDVGEDLEAGRLYLPADQLAAHGLTREDLERMARSGEPDARYRRLVEGLLRHAESEYDHAEAAIRRLPPFFGRPVAVAAEVYRGIHEGIRTNGYDNLTRRASTSLFSKLRLGFGALRGLGRARASRTAGLGRAALALAVALAAALGVAAGSAGWLEAQSPPAVDPAGATTVAPGASLSGSPAMATASRRDGLARVRHLWVRAVDDPGAVTLGLGRTEGAVAEAGGAADPGGGRLLRAYHGAFLALRAKHGGGPRQRLRDLRQGFDLMDQAVDEEPDSPELRYIRLMSGFYLPGIFGRGAGVRADFAALARLLPEAGDVFPTILFPEVVAFVLQHGDLAPPDRARLEGLLHGAEGP
jgi:15-cis-phytoene synthase